ncbi:MAG: SCP2 sterol-binding domain-containing protein [Desulfurococcales archaeon]|nr:SCP2 sterol-binding domain-containing protein [Desulfurococcales archaeon]
MAGLEEFKTVIEDLFKKALEKDPSIKGWSKVYQFVVKDNGEFYIEIKDGELKVVEGKHPRPIATLTTDSDTLKKVLSGELDAMKAFMMRKIAITGNVLDTMNLKKLIDLGTGKV